MESNSESDTDTEIETSRTSVAPRRGTRVKKPTLKAQQAALFVKRISSASESSSVSNESNFEFDDEFDNQKPAVLHNSDDVAGKEMFGFHSMKKQIGLLQKAEEVKSQEAKTPARIRSRIKKEIAAKLLEGDSSNEDPYEDSSSEFDVSSDAEDSTDSLDETENEVKPQTRQTVQKKTINLPTKELPKRKRNRAYVIKTDEYFYHNASKKIGTSNHTLDKLETPRLPQDKLRTLLKTSKIPEPHRKAMKNMAQYNTSFFTKWLYLLYSDFNILVYGLGSKKDTLQQFQTECLSDLPVVVINGFFPSLSIKDILDGILKDLLGVKESFSDVYEACEAVVREMEFYADVHVFLVIHNIEGDGLRNSKAQNILSMLAVLKNVHLVASIDHINGPLVWDYTRLSKYNFTWWDVTSYQLYTSETAFENTAMTHASGAMALASLHNVFLSLTSNAKGIYLKLIEYQLENGKVQYYQGMPLKKLYSQCREAFLVSSDLALRAQLTEFIDHKMVKVKRSAEGTEYLTIPVNNSYLQQFLDEQKQA